jgi:predicted NUDIX family NTP pyrophosphohydrolase
VAACAYPQPWLAWIQLSSTRSKKQSAGILLYRLTRGGPEILLAHPGGPFWARKDLGAWSIPKGECEDGEEPQASALREFEEELGAPLPADPGDLVELGEVRYKSGKFVRAWAANGDFDPVGLRSNTFSMQWPPRSGKEREFPEVDRAAWFKPAEAREKILEAQAPFVERLLEYLSA